MAFDVYFGNPEVPSMPNKSAVRRWQAIKRSAQNGRGVSRVRCNSHCAKGVAGMDRNTNRTGSTPQDKD